MDDMFVFNAEDYLMKHLYSELWIKATDQEALLKYAEIILKSKFTFREGAESTENYLHAVCEQAIHLLMFDQDLFKLQQAGVQFYGIDGMQFNMKNALISPIAKGLLKPITKSRVGDIL